MYGDWRQYRRRVMNAHQDFGVGCRECVADESACEECEPLMRSWGDQHPPFSRPSIVVSALEQAQHAAGLPDA